MRQSVRLCVVRHGETDWNAARRLQGHTDIPLNRAGRLQALATARQLTDEIFDSVYSSDLMRAAHTAATLCATSKAPVRLRADLRERHFGALQGLTADEMRARFPEIFDHVEVRDPTLLPQGGESLAGFARRVRATFDTIAAAHPGQQVLVVTHGGVLDILYRLANDRPLDAPRDFLIPNAALNWLVHDGTRWSIEHWALKAHLTDARDELPNS